MGEKCNKLTRNFIIIQICQLQYIGRVQGHGERRGRVSLWHVPHAFALIGKGGEKGHIDNVVGLAICVFEFDESEGWLNAFTWINISEKQF